MLRHCSCRYNRRFYNQDKTKWCFIQYAGALSGQIFDDVEKEGETISEDEVKEDITAILSGADLDEEFQKKATTVFEAAVSAKVTKEVAKLKETAERRISEELENPSRKSSLIA